MSEISNRLEARIGRVYEDRLRGSHTAARAECGGGLGASLGGVHPGRELAAVVPAPAIFQPKLPPGFKVSVFATGLVGPRWLAVAPNGDVFVADSAGGEVIVLHGVSAKGEAESRAVFADHLNLPFGIAFRGDHVYVADSDEVLRSRSIPQDQNGLAPPSTSSIFPAWAITNTGHDR